VVDPQPVIPCRCLVCGHEHDLDPWRAAENRDPETGRFAPLDDGAEVDAWRYPDGRVAACCSHHTPEEARTAFVLAERTLERAVLAPPRGAAWST